MGPTRGKPRMAGKATLDKLRQQGIEPPSDLTMDDAKELLEQKKLQDTERARRETGLPSEVIYQHGPPPPGVRAVHDEGEFWECDTAIVGESHYQHNLKSVRKRLCGRNPLCWAVLQHEPDNPVDKNAILVTIDGLPVGYLPKEQARVTRLAEPIAVPAKLYTRNDNTGVWVAWQTSNKYAKTGCLAKLLVAVALVIIAPLALLALAAIITAMIP